MDPVTRTMEDDQPTPLGPLERLIHRAVWMRGSATVREVLQDRSIWQTYSTVLTTMDRLFRKGLLDRTGEGKAFRYRVRCSPGPLVARARAWHTDLRETNLSGRRDRTCESLS